MKVYLLLIALLIFHSGFCQDGILPLNEQKNIYYADAVRPAKSKAEIYKSAQNWVSKTFGNYDNAVTLQDAQAGKLVLNTYVPVRHSVYDYIRFNLTIDCYDHLYQAKIDQLDGISQTHSPVRITARENEDIQAKSVLIKTETNRKKKNETEQSLQTAIADNENINNAMYNLLGSLKEFITKSVDNK